MYVIQNQLFSARFSTCCVIFLESEVTMRFYGWIKSLTFKSPALSSSAEKSPLPEPPIFAQEAAKIYGLNGHQFNLLSKIFEPQCYRDLISLDTVSDTALFDHYLKEGLSRNLPPSPFFQIERAQKLLPPNIEDARPLLIKWLTSPDRRRIIPTCHFDEDFYVSKNLDVFEAGAPPFEHFLEYGSKEGREPNALFDRDWYEGIVWNSKGIKQGSLYVHYLRNGLPNGIPPREALSAFFAQAGKDHGSFHETYEKLLSTSRKWVSEFGLGKFDIFAEIFGNASIPFNSSIEEDIVEKFMHFLSSQSYPFDLSESQFKLLRKLFVPEFYQANGNADQISDDHLFAHYLLEGLPIGLSPSPLFQNDIIEEVLPTEIAGTEPAIVRWLKSPMRENLVPTLRFSAWHYQNLYPDVLTAGITPFEHFLEKGLQEGREPNALFDVEWYRNASAHRGKQATMPSYLRYLIYDLQKGMPPRAILIPLFGLAADSDTDFSACFDNLLRATQPWLSRFGFHKLIILIGLFFSPSYEGRGRLRAGAHAIERFIDFLDIGALEGLDPGPLFDSKVYLQEAERAGRAVPVGANALLNFLLTGIHHRILPTKIFNEQRYLDDHADIDTSQIWGFEHFVVFGILEGRKSGSGCWLSLAQPINAEDGHALQNWIRFWAFHDERVAKDAYLRFVAITQAKVASILNSTEFLQIVTAAQELEPTVGDVVNISHILAPPLHDYKDTIRRKLITRVKNKTYDSVICIPWLRTGGADLVSCLFAESLLRICPGEKVLLLQTDHSHVERADWIPPAVERVDISDLLTSVSSSDAEFLLFTFILALAPKRLININSKLCWAVLERFGSRLRPLSALYSYLFCWDQTERGLKVGYPSLFFPGTANNLDCTFTDSDYLKAELLKIYRLPAALHARLVTLHSPSRATTDDDFVAIKTAASNTLRSRPLVLWGGRLDRQKRFDIVQKVAALLPGLDFICWGSPLLDAGPDLSKSPSNLELRPPFKNFEDLPLNDCVLWLYTSAWDGLPTILIEIARRGVPIVASAVGGVPELIDESTGWPVREVNDSSAYVEAINDALNRPEERSARTRKLVERVSTVYTRKNFDAELVDVLKRETSRLQ
jgi:glycosyltransferase involved in cell wall biosynthesis